MLGHDAGSGMAFRQRPDSLKDREAAFLKISETRLIKLVVVCFEGQQAARPEKGEILHQLAGMGQPVLAIALFRPWVAEIDVNALDFILRAQNVGDPLDILRGEQQIIDRTASRGKDPLGVAFGKAEDLALEIDPEEIFLRALKRGLCDKSAFPAAEFEGDRAGPDERPVPPALEFFGTGRKKWADGEFGARPPLSSDTPQPYG